MIFATETMQGPPPASLLEPAIGSLFPAIGVVVVILALVVPIYFVGRFLRAYERRSSPLIGRASADQRIEVLEAQVERLTADLDRWTEAQQFTTQLLGERPRQIKGSIAP